MRRRNGSSLQLDFSEAQDHCRAKSNSQLIPRGSGEIGLSEEDASDPLMVLAQGVEP